MTRPQLSSHWIFSGRVSGKPTLLYYPLDSDLSDGRCYPNFEQLEIGCLHTQHCTCTFKAIENNKRPFL